jgi:glycosyltransferase involved in cell wall biosynthesis
MKILITDNEMEKLKSRDLIPIECDICGKEFFREKHYVQSSIKEGTKIFRCNKKCYNKQGKIVKCNYCQKEIYKLPNALKKSKTYYCSSKCSCAQGNKIRWENHIPIFNKCIKCKRKIHNESKLCQSCFNLEKKEENKNITINQLKEKYKNKFNGWYSSEIRNYNRVWNKHLLNLGDKFTYVTTNIRHYSIQEQIFLPFTLYRLMPDLVHFTHFNKPVFYFGKSVVTIHDLIKHFFKGRLNTTKNASIYWIKHFFYIILTNIVIKTNTIIVPSDYWRDYIIKNFHISPQKITTTHEAVDPAFLEKISEIKTDKTKTNQGSPYIIYTGNLYPHKNINVIVEALRELPNIRLKIICSRNYFTQRIEELLKKYKMTHQVDFLGYIPDDEFKQIYSHALALVHPSLMEGFSLTGLEAMALGCPVISSNSTCLPEIYQNSVLYFDPNNFNELVSQLKKIQKDPCLREKLIKLGYKQVQKYSWNDTAKKTSSVYKKLLIKN